MPRAGLAGPSPRRSKACAILVWRYAQILLKAAVQAGQGARSARSATRASGQSQTSSRALARSTRAASTKAAGDAARLLLEDPREGSFRQPRLSWPAWTGWVPTGLPLHSTISSRRRPEAPACNRRAWLYWLCPPARLRNSTRFLATAQGQLRSMIGLHQRRLWVDTRIITPCRGEEQRIDDEDRVRFELRRA